MAAFLPLGSVVRLILDLDVEAGKVDELLRDRLEFEVLQKLAVLPAEADLDMLHDRARADMARLHAETQAVAESRSTPRAAVQADFSVIADAMLIRAAAPDGGLFAGYRWRLVRRGRVDISGFHDDVRGVSQRIARWVAH